MVHGLSLATITERWSSETPFVQVSTTWGLTCPEMVRQRPCMTREIEAWLSDSRVSNNSVVDHRSWQPVLSPLHTLCWQVSCLTHASEIATLRRYTNTFIIIIVFYHINMPWTWTAEPHCSAWVTSAFHSPWDSTTSHLSCWEKVQAKQTGLQPTSSLLVHTHDQHLLLLLSWKDYTNFTGS